MNIIQSRLSARPERMVYSIDIGNMSIADAKIAVDKITSMYRQKNHNQKEPSVIEKIVELIGPSGSDLCI